MQYGKFSGANMKRNIVLALTIGSTYAFAGTAVHAGPADETLARVEALQKENAAFRKEIAALRENRTLRERTKALNSSAPPQGPQTALAPGEKSSDPFGAYAADLPVSYKAPAAREPGRFRVWGEGGAIWSGGDPVNAFYDSTNTVPGLDLTPKVGWEAAAGFDYRFGASPWHVNGQFRYGEARVTAGIAGPLVFPPGQLNLGPLDTFTAFQSVDASNRESHWLADLAIGRDVLGTGRDAMQLNFGVRIAELKSSINQSVSTILSVSYNPPHNNGTLFSEAESAVDGLGQQSSFFGAGPRIGIEGAVPFAGSWSFDYLGDAAVLFGNRKFQQTSSTVLTATSNSVSTGMLSGSASSAPDRTFATVFNADIQIGLSYWMTESIKLSASYRLDAYFGALSTTDALQDPTKLHSIDRYTHGPHVGISAAF
jgi:hypothetical protein